MSYKSPIEVIYGQVQTKFEEGVLKAVQKCDFSVDQYELAKALMYDRDQYVKGYNDRDAEIIHCKDCKHSYDDIGGLYCSYGVCVDCLVDEDFYCANGARHETGE